MEHIAPAYSSDASEASASRAVVANSILDDPRFQTLVHRRRTFSWSLTALMLTVYFTFILTLAFSPDLLGRPITEGLPATWGIPVGFGMFVVTFLLVAVYVFRANTAYDSAISEIKHGFEKASGTDCLGQSTVAQITGLTPSTTDEQLCVRVGIRHKF